MVFLQRLIKYLEYIGHRHISHRHRLFGLWALPHLCHLRMRLRPFPSSPFTCHSMTFGIIIT